MVRLEGVTMAYPVGTSRVMVLSEISLEMARGERVAVVGPSGSGKTTLLLLLAGLERPTVGSVVLNGEPLEHMDSDDLADFRRDHLGIIFQLFHLVGSLTALDNVALPLEIAGWRGARERAAAMLDRVGLKGRGAHHPGQLSGGEQQRVAIAGRWYTSRRCCWQTSPRAIWTTTPASRWRTCCSSSPQPPARPWYW